MNQARWSLLLLAALLLSGALFVPAWGTETGTGEERRYNGQQADYEDPEFLKLLGSGFFEEEETGSVGNPSASIDGYTLGANYTHNAAFEGFHLTRGIDVSRWNVPVTGANDTPVPIDWQKVKDSGVEFVFIRCAYRSTSNGSLNKDIRFDMNMKGAQAAGLKVGVYIYSQAITESESRAEAKLALDMSKKYDFELPIVIDYEYYSSGRLKNAKLTNAKRTSICKAFCQTVEEAGYPAAIYANKSMLTDDMDGKQLTDVGYEVWLAQWTAKTTYAHPYTYWQYTSDGVVPGISGRVDLNFRYELPGTEITGTVSTKSGIRILWEETPLADGYRVYRRERGASGWKLLAAVSGRETVTYLDQTAAEGKGYEYAVRVVKGGNQSPYLRSGVETVHQPVFSISSALIRKNGVQLNWEAQSAGGGYQIYRRASHTEEWKLVNEIADPAQTSWLDTDIASLESGKTYYYTISLLGTQSGEMPDPWGTELCWLATPEVTSVAPARKGMTVQWKRVPGADGYRVYRREENGWKKLTDLTGEAVCSYNDKTALTMEQSYRYTVRAVRGKTQSWYDEQGLTGLQYAPPKPLKVTIQHEGLEFAWEPVPDAQSYNVYRKSGSGGWTRLATVGGERTSYLDRTAPGGVSVTYTVRSLRAGSQSQYDTAGVSGAYLTSPELTGAASASGGIKVSWKKVAGASTYTVYRKGETGGWKKLADTSGVSYIDSSDLSGGGTYRYTVRARGKVLGRNLVSWYDEKGVSARWLAAPHMKRAANANGGLQITWEPSAGATAYQVYRKTSTTGWQRIAELNGETLTWLDDGAQSGTKYTYTVRAWDGTCLSGYESGISQLRLESPEVTQTENTRSGAKIRWKAVSGAVSYDVYRKAEGGSWKKLGNVTGTTYTDTSSLDQGVKYFYTVRAVNGGAVSGYLSGRHYYVLPQPKLISALNREGGVLVSWQKVADADSYAVYRKTASTGWKRLGETGSLTWTDGTASSGSTYFYTVRALRAGVQSSYDSKGISAYHLQTPDGLKLTRAADSAVFSWNKVAGATGYRVYRKTTGGWKLLDTVTGTSYRDREIIELGTTCTYTVRAVNGNKLGWYLEKGVWFSAPPTPVLTEAENLPDGIQISWEEIPGAESYAVYRRDSASGWQRLTVVEENTWLDESARDGVTYRYTVRVTLQGVFSWYDNNGISCLRAVPELPPAETESGGTAESQTEFH